MERLHDACAVPTPAFTAENNRTPSDPLIRSPFVPKFLDGPARTTRRARRAGPLIGSLAGLALLGLGTASCSSDGGTTSAQPSTAPSVATPSAAAPSSAPSQSAGAAGAVKMPDQIASLRKSSDQTTAQSLLKQIQSAPGGEQLIAVSYEDSTDKTRTVLIYGGSGPLPPGDPDSQLLAMLGSGTASGVKIGDAVSVDPGPAGGTAKCAPIPGNDKKVINCGWINGKTALVMSFTGFDQTTAQSLVPKIVGAMI
jgi:hypothetical protein